MDVTPQSIAAATATTTTLEQAAELMTAPLETPVRSNNRAKRNYRIKSRDSNLEDEDGNRDGDQDIDQTDGPAQLNQQEQASLDSLTSSSPYIQSQKAQNIAEVYPGLARLSFLDQDQDQGLGKGSDGGSVNSFTNVLETKKQRRPFQQQPTMSQITIEDPDDISKVEDQKEKEMRSLSTSSTSTSTSSNAKSKAVAVPPVTSPAAMSSKSGSGSGSSLFEIRETELEAKGRGIFSAANEILKPGTLVFKELGYCQVVDDESLSQVCSTCFKDVRDELGEDEASSASVNGQKKLVRCAGCKVVWYCNKACQIKDWKLHHQLECQGIQRSMSSPVMKEIWTKRTINTTIARALCRLIRRRERVKASKAYKVEHGKIDNSQKQVNEVYFSGLDQKEEEWLDEYGSTWIEQYLRTYEQEKTPVAATATNSSSLGTLEESSPLAKTLAIVMSCVVTPTEDRNVFLKSVREPCVNVESASGDSALDLLRKLNSYGFAITNMETTTAVGLALYVQCIPFMNHSCIPNCVYTFRGSRVECRVIRDIQPGEELTISYIDQIGTTQERQKQLKEQYRFTCDCPLCKYYPANPLAQPEDGPLRQIIADPLFEPRLDPKQGFVCSNLSCKAINGPKSILAIDSQLAIYNKVELKCSSCGHCTEITQELVQENEKEAQKLIAEFVREMNGGVERQIPKSNSRNFELAKVKASSSETPSEDTNSMERKPATAVIGGLKTVREPSARALKNFQDAFKVITGRPTSDSEKAVPAIDSAQSICRSHLHRLSRQLIQIGFDEAVSHKNWVFALHRSIELERLLNESYIGHHPLKAIQAYYTCKIANLLANLLLEESTVEIEDSEEEKDKDYGMLDSDDEADLKLLRDAMRKNGTGSMQEQLLRRKRKENEEGSSTGEGNAEDRRKKRVQEKEVSRTQIESSQQLQRYLQSLVPKIEDPKILVQVRTCWGKDGKLGSRYRCLIDSLKQALHYAALPFVSQEQKQKTI